MFPARRWRHGHLSESGNAELEVMHVEKMGYRASKIKESPSLDVERQTAITPL